jgi:hypothetical protein
MVYQRIPKPSSWNPPSQAKSSPLATHPFAVQVQQDSHRPPTQEEIENEAFNQNKFEALGLQLKNERGAITAVEQERLSVLQTTIDDFRVQRRERGSAFDHNFANILVHAPGLQRSTPVQPRLGIQPDRASVPPQTSQEAIASNQNEGMDLIQRAFLARNQHHPMLLVQAKLNIGQHNDRYEQEADRVASQAVEQIHAPVSVQTMIPLGNNHPVVQRVVQSKVLPLTGGGNLVQYYSTYDSKTVFETVEEAWKYDAKLKQEKEPGINSRFIKGVEERVPTPYTYHQVDARNIIGDTGAGKWGPHTVAHVDITSNLQAAVKNRSLKDIFDEQVLAPDVVITLLNEEYGTNYKPDQYLRYSNDYNAMYARIKQEFAKAPEKQDQDLLYELLMRLMQLHPYTTYGKRKVSHKSTKGKGEKAGKQENADLGGKPKYPERLLAYIKLRTKLTGVAEEELVSEKGKRDREEKSGYTSEDSENKRRKQVLVDALATAMEQEPQQEDEVLSPLDVMTILGRRAPDSLYIMADDDWKAYAEYKAAHPEKSFSD